VQWRARAFTYSPGLSLFTACSGRSGLVGDAIMIKSYFISLMRQRLAEALRTGSASMQPPAVRGQVPRDYRRTARNRRRYATFSKSQAKLPLKPLGYHCLARPQREEIDETPRHLLDLARVMMDLGFFGGDLEPRPLFSSPRDEWEV
jgi:hypothetical protein